MQLVTARVHVEGAVDQVVRELGSSLIRHIGGEPTRRCVVLTVAVKDRGPGSACGFRSPYDLPAIIDGCADDASAFLESLRRQSRIEQTEYHEVAEAIARFASLTK